MVLANRINNQDRVDSLLEIQGKSGRATKLTGDNMETARLGLEDKISQLNQAIDDVRQQLGSVNGNSGSETEN
ncbi:hypothetical protein A19Y_1379 [Planktothrix agardhii NIVA-CYA 126/8]|uniref:Uncharacterized protein n=1 Tax=Planktothrix agardhii (strain NIVA-CYA 126/8) TaxID=388467 RepID=A0A073CDR8_PLAA1|nr:hypothetical protein A19Y_1379 [Planktothrix agardhii NIVA-CYA 126/8]